MISAFLIAFCLSLIPFQNSCKELNNDVFRLHILANSDSAVDQSIKLSVRDRVLSEVSRLYDRARTKEDAERITAQNLPHIRDVAKAAVADSGEDHAVSVRMTNLYFNTRYYEDITMPAGYYDALQIVIGEGRGRNWWCVMYPSLCVGAAAKEEAKERLDPGEYDVITSDDLRFRFKIVEYYEKLRSWFT